VSPTRVFKVDPAAAANLQQRLREELPPDADWYRVDYARYAVKALDSNLVCYTSGKLVLQGKGADGFARRFLEGLEDGQRPAEPAMAFEVPTIGSDEAGKGDYFGPLVVAAIYAEPDRRSELTAMGVADSKTLSDQRMFPMAELIERSFDCEVRVLMPEDYNERWNRERNVNHVLAELHADAIATLLQRHPEAVVIVDQFGHESLIADRLRNKLGRAPRKLTQVPRAEAHPVVGAASIVARVHFVEGFQRCEESSGTDLHKGGGAPVDVAAARAYRIGGPALMAKIAKLHFKNSDRLPGALS
jgi:ribonuclease HIII